MYISRENCVQCVGIGEILSYLFNEWNKITAVDCTWKCSVGFLAGYAPGAAEGCLLPSPLIELDFSQIFLKEWKIDRSAEKPSFVCCVACCCYAKQSHRKNKLVTVYGLTLTVLDIA